MAEQKPWWRRWDGMPSILERSIARELQPSEVWVSRSLLSVLFVLGMALALKGMPVALAILGIVAVQLVATPTHQRRQILGR